MSDDDAAGAGMQPLMDTDSERLMAEGIATGVSAFEQLQAEWCKDNPVIDRTVCHQVGSRHREAMLAAMGLDPKFDGVTFPKLGNTGSVALPLTLAASAAAGEITKEDRVALLGIGSGINSVMLGTQWNETKIAGNIHEVVEVTVGT
jgi:3-oxoacyl-[acyl-carrier-protein] synthase-3